MYKLNIQPHAATCWDCSQVSTKIFRVNIKSKRTFDFYWCEEESFLHFKKTGEFGPYPYMSKENIKALRIVLQKPCWMIAVNKHEEEIEIKAELEEIHEKYLQFRGISGFNGFGLNGLSGFGISTEY